MGVDRDAGDAEGVAEDDVGRLSPDSRQGDQVLEARGHLAAESLAEHLAQPDERRRLVAEEPGGPDEGLELVAVGGGVAGGGAVAREQRRRDLVDPLVGALGAEDGGDHQLERGAEVELAVGVRIEGGELLVDASRAPDEREAGLPRGGGPRLRGRAAGHRISVRGGRSPFDRTGDLVSTRVHMTTIRSAW